MCIQLFIWDERDNKLKQSKLLYIQLSIWDSIIYTFSMNRFIVYNKQTNTTNNNNKNSHNNNWSLTPVSSSCVDRSRERVPTYPKLEMSLVQCNNNSNVYSISHSLFLYLSSIPNENFCDCRCNNNNNNKKT